MLTFQTVSQIPELNIPALMILDSLPPDCRRWDFLYLFGDKYPQYKKPIRKLGILLKKQAEKRRADEKYAQFLAENGFHNLEEWQVSESHTYLSK